jgi:hypothetical protein
LKRAEARQIVRKRLCCPQLTIKTPSTLGAATIEA